MLVVVWNTGISSEFSLNIKSVHGISDIFVLKIIFVLVSVLVKRKFIIFVLVSILVHENITAWNPRMPSIKYLSLSLTPVS